MANQVELRKIAKSRLRAGYLLMQAGDHDAAVYMMGYAVECALKAVICRRLNLGNYPDQRKSNEVDKIFKTHKFDILLLLSGMESDFSMNSDLTRYQNWSIATKWNPEMRYDPIGTRIADDAKKMYNALTDEPGGVISWIKKHRKW